MDARIFESVLYKTVLAGKLNVTDGALAQRAAFPRRWSVPHHFIGGGD